MFGFIFRNRFIYVATLLLVSAWGCGDNPTAPTTLPLNPDRDGDGFLDDVDACPDQSASGPPSNGCPDAMVAFLEWVRMDVEFFWTETFGGDGMTYSPISTFQWYTTPIDTPCGPAGLRNALYCSTDSAVHYDYNYLQEFHDVGDAASAFVVGHEIGHHVSYILGWTSVLSFKQNELQADCFSGAWLRGAADRGLLDEGDIDEMFGAADLVGNPKGTWFDPNVHGTLAQRKWAALIGLHGEAVACGRPAFIDALPVPLVM